ncbi:MAG: FG-GAP repeat protein [Rudanella sp.]|nr:FG-GAP repeat protein [Rudanella sp.]
MKPILYFSLLFCSLLAQPAFAQIGMSGQPHPSAVLDLKVTDKAFYPPRLTTAQRNAIVNPQPGAFVYDLDKGTVYLFDGQNCAPLAITSANNLAPVDRFANDGAAEDQFGFSVAISGDYAVVGTPADDIGANSKQGSAYVFVRNGSTWTQQVKLTASDGAASDFFGASVAISGDYVVVGAFADDIGSNNNQGSAYVFVRTGSSWTQQAKLTADDGAADDNFGNSVAVSGDYVVVGALSDDNGVNTNQGSAYVFVRSGTLWPQQVKLIASDGAANDIFGSSVAISGNYALVGAFRDDNGANTDQGSAYVFARSGTFWLQQPKLITSDGALDDQFGISVAISGDYALVGAYKDNIETNTDQGSAYVFVRSGSTWTQQARLTASDGALDDQFGISVAISGDYALVGAFRNDNGANTDQGSAYVFLRIGTNWQPVRSITDNAPANTKNGYGVGISNGTFIIGGSGFNSDKGKVAFGTVDN